MRRDPSFMYSDVHRAAEDFVEEISEHAEPIWEFDDKRELTDQLTDRAMRVLSDKDASL